MELPFWTAAPFAVLLAAVAALPILRGDWWHANRHKAIVCAVLAVPAAAYLMWAGPDTRHALGHEVANYASFIVLLTSLYVIAGGIAVTGRLPARPLTNALILAGGAVLANFIGTTGASMLLVRPFLRANAHRTRAGHLPVFFIFVVSNTGGLLTPLGDPPLFLGFLNGVDFFWTLRLWPQWLFVNTLVIAVFVAWDVRAGRRDRADAVPDPPAAPPDPPKVVGLALNGPLLAGVVLAVLGTKVLPQPAGEAIMVGLTLVSLWRTPAAVRQVNRFSWGPIGEVAIVFAGIFVTMVPALLLLQQHGARLGLTEAWEYFWATGLLSALLDNAPTYLTLGTVAAGGNGVAWLPGNRPDLLAAVSCGAVFMGAGSYIGNGPNFMVKAIAEETGYVMPSFAGYVGIAAVVLGPVFLAVTLVFFRG